MPPAAFQAGLEELAQVESGSLILALRTKAGQSQSRLFAFQSEPESQRTLVRQPLDAPLTPATVGVGDGNGVLHVVLRGADHDYYYRAFRCNDWAWSLSGWQSLGGPFRSMPVVVRGGSDLRRIDVFGLGDSGELRQKSLLLDDPARPIWKPYGREWVSWGGSFGGYPAVVTPSPGQVVVFATGTAAIRAGYPPSAQPMPNIWWKAFSDDPGSSIPWNPDGEGWGLLPPSAPPLAVVSSPPVAASWNPNRIDLLCLGSVDAADPTPRMLHRYRTPPPEEVTYHRDSRMTWPPTWPPATQSSRDPPRRGSDTYAWGGGDWTAWAPLGAGFIGPPAAVSSGEGRLDLFGLRLDQGKPRLVYQACRSPSGDLSADPTAWQTTWQTTDDDPAGWLLGPPAIAAWDDGSIDLFAPRGDGGIMHAYWESDVPGQYTTWERADPGKWDLLPSMDPF